MKKVLVFFAVIAAVSFSSCANKSTDATTEPVAETETVVEEAAPAVEETTDSTAVEATDSTAVEAAPAE
ncbi:MAG: hypothetical protein PHG27_04380 [Massilibacteroides sp.]|nr:hypothetical protein [Massilibacteroides sp.]MDD3062449.1 hypothetical protein [Massilibacteroides sp.]MDD4114822.1 hypothetical protein [Massilibacteroides sp.]MDD4659852.1 hypothetical protein [Massilibacteroides sp.]